jgi:uncharacterized protein (DUF924 family)
MALRTWVEDVLRFWLEETTSESWFRKDAAFDLHLRQRFLQTHATVKSLGFEACLSDANTALAAVIVLDQFSRNLFRDTPHAFACDAAALSLAEAAIAKGFDAQVGTRARQFFYLPFEHAEDVSAQSRCVALMATLADPEQAKWAEAHKQIIDRFGRFPHRNAVLGRTSTPQELTFLAESGSSF